MPGTDPVRPLGLARLAALYLLVGSMLWLSRPSPTTLALGAPLIALGEAIRIWSAGHLLKTDELITSGPYRHTRNPLYLGRLLIFSGVALATGPVGWWTLLPGWGVFFLYYLPRKERVEPARLLARHGEAYRRYRDKVPALWPTPGAFIGDDVARRWSSRRMRRNREHWMVLGLLALLAFLAGRAIGG